MEGDGEVYMTTFRVAEMILKVMQEEGYDGFTDGEECGCDGSRPCGLFPMECMGAYRHKYSLDLDAIYCSEKCTGYGCKICAQWRSEHEKQRTRDEPMDTDR
jgi:hypothetical protein